MGTLWVARVEAGTNLVQGVVGVYGDMQTAEECRTYMQNKTFSGNNGDLFVIIDANQLPIPEAA